MIHRPDPLRIVHYSDVRKQIQLGDVGVCCGEGLVANIIKRVTDSEYSHVFVCGWFWDSILLAAESTSPESRVVTLSSRVNWLPGGIDIYRPRINEIGTVNLSGVWEFMVRASGIDYPESMLLHDWATVLLEDSRRHYPNSCDPEERRVCSQLVHAAFRCNGMIPIKESDCDTYPVDFANPKWFDYVFTLTL